jgi:acyl dehydratase
MRTQVRDAIPNWQLASVDREKMKTMATLLHDSNLIHIDPSVVEELGMGDRPINQGPINLAYTINMLAAWRGSFDCLLSVRVRFLSNVFSEDAVTASGEVVAVDGDTVTSMIRLDGPSGVVLEGTATVRLAG